MPDAIAKIIVDWLDTEADLLRLTVDGGFSWETVRAELRSYAVENRNAGAAHWMFKCASLLPACVLPPRAYYSSEKRLAASDVYRGPREVAPVFDPTACGSIPDNEALTEWRQRVFRESG